MISTSIFTVTVTNCAPLPSEFLYNFLKNSFVNPPWGACGRAQRIYNDSVGL